MDTTLLEFANNQHLLSFYGYWQFAVCLFAFIGLMGIWWHIGRRTPNPLTKRCF